MFIQEKKQLELMRLFPLVFYGSTLEQPPGVPFPIWRGHRQQTETEK